jgi:preprotein translocase subunit SecA
LIDSFIITNFVDFAVSLRETCFLHQIERAFALKLMPEDMMGDFADVKKQLEAPWGEWEISPMPQNLAEYFDENYQKRRVQDPQMASFMERFYVNEILQKKSKDKRTVQPVLEKSPLLKNVGRNDPCPCGSGKKFKKCCGA